MAILLYIFLMSRRSEDDGRWIQYHLWICVDCCGAVCSDNHGKSSRCLSYLSSSSLLQIIPTSLVFTSSDSIHIQLLFSWGVLPPLQISAASLHLSISVSFPLSPFLPLPTLFHLSAWDTWHSEVQLATNFLIFDHYTVKHQCKQAQKHC